jgi:hypothetical protein
LAETRETSSQNGSHDAAGDHHIRVGQAVANLTTHALSLDDARGTEHGKVL